eukprot:gene3959-2822_t
MKCALLVTPSFLTLHRLHSQCRDLCHGRVCAVSSVYPFCPEDCKHSSWRQQKNARSNNVIYGTRGKGKYLDSRIENKTTQNNNNKNVYTNEMKNLSVCGNVLPKKRGTQEKPLSLHKEKEAVTLTEN